ncbi:MAG: VanW family protein [Saprospiraceae bacterium]
MVKIFYNTKITLFVKKLIPPQFRLRLRVLFTFVKDVLSTHYFSFAKRNAKHISLPRQLSMSQPIRKNDFSENKKHNLRLAIQQIENIEILPQQIFSYWHLIPSPTPQNGFKKGRNLVGNKLDLDFGGGLCQLSGIMYYLVLEAGLDILERHAHSLDIYTEASRYTPIGSDATVVFGHKDLRFLNSFDFPISFQFEVLEEEILIYLCARQSIEKCDLEFLIEKKENGKQVKVTRQRNGKKEICSQDFYKNL